MRLTTRASLEKILRRKVRIKITSRKRGRFTVKIPRELTGALTWQETFPRKREALTFLAVSLRCLTPIVIEVNGEAKK